MKFSLLKRAAFTYYLPETPTLKFHHRFDEFHQAGSFSS
jgi:hypothetical protein